jgi:hypothetical protein
MFMKTQLVKRFLLAGAAATAVVAAPVAGAMLTAPSALADPPAICQDVNQGCAVAAPGVAGIGVPGANAAADTNGTAANVPGAGITTGPNNASAHVPGANASAGPNGANICINGWCANAGR